MFRDVRLKLTPFLFCFILLDITGPAAAQNLPAPDQHPTSRAEQQALANFFSEQHLPDNLTLTLTLGDAMLARSQTCTLGYFQPLQCYKRLDITLDRLTSQTVDADIIRNIFKSLRFTPWIKTDGPDTSMVCCDGIASWQLAFEQDHHHILCSSRSVMGTPVPWQIEIDGTFYTTDSEIAYGSYLALHDLWKVLKA